MPVDASAGTMLARGFDWEKVRFPAQRIGDLVTLRYGKALVAKNRRPGPIPMFGTNGQCGWHDEPLSTGPGVVLGRKGQGHLGVKWCDSDFWVIDTAYFAEVDPHAIDLRWFYYAAKYVGLDHLKTGEKPGLSRDVFSRQVFPIPERSEQVAIAEVLAVLDDKIAANQKLIGTLGATCQALFRSWFVDFDPVLAKREGRQPPHLSMEVAALFPDALVQSEFGPVPRGWKVQRLESITDKIGSGATPRGGKSTYVSHGVALIRSQNVYDSSFHWQGLARITDAAAERLNGVTVQPGDVLLNITGASILRTCIVDPDALPARVNQHVAIVRPQLGVPPCFIHMHLLRPTTKAYLLGMDAGGSREAITKGHIESVPIVVPDASVLSAFDRLTAPFVQHIENSTSESRTLALLRETLLPRLLSGALRVQDAEQLIGGAV